MLKTFWAFPAKSFPCLLTGPWESPVIPALDLADMPKLEGQWVRWLCKREQTFEPTYLDGRTRRY